MCCRLLPFYCTAVRGGRAWRGVKVVPALVARHSSFFDRHFRFRLRFQCRGVKCVRVVTSSPCAQARFHAFGFQLFINLKWKTFILYPKHSAVYSLASLASVAAVVAVVCVFRFNTRIVVLGHLSDCPRHRRFGRNVFKICRPSDRVRAGSYLAESRKPKVSLNDFNAF